MPLSKKELEQLYLVANTFLPNAISYAKRVCNLEPENAEEIFNQSLFNISTTKNTLKDVKNLSAYIFASYKHSLIGWAKVKQKEVNIDDLVGLEDKTTNSFYQEIEKRILLEEVIRLMTPQERFIYDHLTLDNSYEQIAEDYNAQFGKSFTSNVLRSKYSKAIKKIAKILQTKS